MNHKISIRTHSKTHLEIKTIYPLDGSVRTSRFRTDYYFFFPAQLQVPVNSVSPKHFISRTSINTRFSSPAVSLENLISPDCAESPLNRIREYLTGRQASGAKYRDTVLYELRTLVNIYRAELRGLVLIIRKEMKRANRQEVCQERITRVLELMQSFLTDFRSLQPDFLSNQVNDTQRNALNRADEAISMITESGLQRLFEHSRILGSDAQNLSAEIERLVQSESEYRVERGYCSDCTEENPRTGETLAYRESILKKWSQSALYMDAHGGKSPRRIRHLLAGVSAAAAMLFAVSAAILAERLFQRNSTPWIVLIVLSYVFKDRIKETLRDALKRALPQLIADRVTVLTDPGRGRREGISKSSVSFGKADRIPGHIAELRFRKINPFRSIMPVQDSILFTHDVKLRSDRLKAAHTRLDSITEIIRFNVKDWLTEMDDPKNIYYTIRNGQRIKIKGNRVYKVHLVTDRRDRGTSGSHHLSHYRIVLNRSGILRIETISPQLS